MSRKDVVGKWTVSEASGELLPLVTDVGHSFSIDASSSDAFSIQGAVGLQFLEEIVQLDSVPYDPKQNVLRGTCEGKVRNHRAVKFNVFVAFFDGVCKGVIFPAHSKGSGIGEDNSVGSWTANKQESRKPHRRPRAKKRA